MFVHGQAVGFGKVTDNGFGIQVECAEEGLFAMVVTSKLLGKVIAQLFVEDEPYDVACLHLRAGQDGYVFAVAEQGEDAAV